MLLAEVHEKVVKECTVALMQHANQTCLHCLMQPLTLAPVLLGCVLQTVHQHC